MFLLYSNRIAFPDLNEPVNKFQEVEDKIQHVNSRLEIVSWANVKFVFLFLAILCVLICAKKIINRIQVLKWDVVPATVISGNKTRKGYKLTVITESQITQTIRTTYPIPIDDEITVALSPHGRVRADPRWFGSPKFNYLKEIFKIPFHFILGSTVLLFLWGCAALYLGWTGIYSS